VILDAKPSKCMSLPLEVIIGLIMTLTFELERSDLKNLFRDGHSHVEYLW